METAPNHPAPIKVLARRTLIPLEIQTPWILMRLTYPLSSVAVAFETAFVLSANN